MKADRVYFIGIGGVGVSALAQIDAGKGRKVAGSDAHLSDVTERLRAMGITVYEGHDPAHLRAAEPELVVFTDAVGDANPELAEARRRGLPTMRRAEYLGRIMDDFAGPRIAVAGTHGKTSTTAMLGEILVTAGLDPTVLIGGDYRPFGGNLRSGRSGVMVTEACEAFRSFHHLRPDIAIVTNVEPDHLDCYGDEAGVIEGFKGFVSGIRSGGALVIGLRGPAEAEVADHADRRGLRVIRYGIEGAERLDLKAEAVRHDTGRVTFTYRMADASASVSLRIPGEHNVLNALGAIGASLAAGAEPSACAEGIERFGGVGRRFELLGVRHEITVIDDYAHHPTEIRATIAATRETYPGRRLFAVFQPHLYSRTRDFMSEFAAALSEADAVILTGIYAAREMPVEGIHATALAGRIAETAPLLPLLVENDKGRVPALLDRVARPGDVVLILGAGDIREAGEDFVSGRWTERGRGQNGRDK